MYALGSSIHANAVMVSAGISPRHGEHIRDTMAKAMGLSRAPTGRLVNDAKKHGAIVLCPHSRMTHKEWPESRWKELSDALVSLGHTVIAACSPGRYFLGKMAPELGMTGLTNLLGGAAMVISIDTGTIHLADALRVPVIGLYATTSIQTYGPYNDASRCICKHRQESDARGFKPYDSAKHLPASAMQAIAVEDVLEEVRRG